LVDSQLRRRGVRPSGPSGARRKPDDGDVSTGLHTIYDPNIGADESGPVERQEQDKTLARRVYSSSSPSQTTAFKGPASNMAQRASVCGQYHEAEKARQRNRVIIVTGNNCDNRRT